jgi:predicted MFS family arabinose efflux permease
MPALGLIASPATELVLGLSLVRGAGLGIVVVVGSTLAAELARPTVVFTAITIGAGVSATFLPLAVSAEARGTAALALLVQSLSMSAARFAAGRFGDRHGSGRLLVPSVLVSAVGAALLLWANSSLAMVVGMALFGAGFGVAQNVTLTLMIERVDAAEYGRTSALWNLAYDAGFGIGAVGFGLAVGPFGYGTGFAFTAAVLLAALVPAMLDRREGKP